MTLPRALREAEANADALINRNAGNTDGQSTPSTNDKQVEPQGTPQNATPQDDSTDWKHKFSVLQGKYNSEIGPLREKVRQLEGNAVSSEQVAQLQQQLQQLQSDNTQLKQTLAEHQQQQETSNLNPYLVDEYGDDFARAVAEQASLQTKSLRQEFENKISELTQQVQSSQNNVQQVATDNRMQTLKSVLGNRQVNFDQVNNDPDFHNWLSEVDPYSGMQRQALLETAFNQGDIERTARFYTAFVESQKSTPNNPLRDHVDPTHGNSFADTGSQTSTFDPNALVQLGRQLQLGKITQAEYDQREKQLFAAMNG